MLLFCCALLLSCNNEQRHSGVRSFESVYIEDLLQDSILSIRALDVNDAFVYYGSADHIGEFALKNELKVDLNKLHISNGKNHFKNVFTYDGKPLHFRAISYNGENLFGISIENPARLYRLSRQGNGSKLVYEENHPKVFYDAMAFWNEKEGLVIGDPINGCLSIIITRDGGQTWAKIPCEQLPEAIEGEAAFAASNTNISIKGDKTWVATGGVASRILYSADKGNTWQIFNTPIVQGSETTGMYSIDFYDELNGFAIGGDYTKPLELKNNKIRTSDGGQTWISVANDSEPGYRSCVQYVPHSDAKGLVAVGYNGIDYSKDSGTTWIHLSDEGFYTIRFINDTVAYAGGRGRLSKLTFRE